MDSALIEMAVSAAAGGALQVVSEVFKLGQSGLGTLRELADAKAKRTAEAAEQENAHADAAAKRTRNSGWLTSTLAVIAFVAAFVLTWFTGIFGIWGDLPTSIVSEQAGWSFLWGLIETGPELVVTEARGVVHGPEFWPTVRNVACFVFGIKAVSTGSRWF